jgi:hypothetical protein
MADTFVATSLAQEPAHARKKLLTPRRFYYVTIFALFVVALVLRCLHVYWIFYSPVYDMVEYLQYANTAFAWPPNRATMEFTVTFPPGYPLWLWLTTVVLKIPPIKGVLYIQAVLNALAVFPLAEACRRIFSTKAGIIAACFYAFHKPFIFATSLLMSEAVMIPVLSVWLYFLIVINRKFSWLRLFFFVLATSYLIHTRVNLALYIPIATLAIYKAKPCCSSLRTRLVRAVTYLVLTAASFLPWSIRNTILNQRFSFISCNGQRNFFEGNNPLSIGTVIPEFRKYNAIYPAPQRKKGEPLIDFYQRLGNEGRRFFYSHLPYNLFICMPARMERLLSTNFYYMPMWDKVSSGIFTDYPFGPYLFIPLVDWNVLLPLSLIGIFIPKRNGSWLFLLLILLTFPPYLLTHTGPRYRYPLDMIAMIFVGGGLAYVLNKNYIKWLKYIAFSLVGLVILLTSINLTRFSGENLLSVPKLVSLTQEGTECVKDELKIRGKRPKVFLGEVKIDSRYVSHLLLEFYYRIELSQRVASQLGDPRWSGKGPNVTETYYNDKGITITVPWLGGTGLLKEAHQLNLCQERGGTAWRVLAIPPLATRVRLELENDLDESTVTISRLSLRGPIWWPRSTE